VNDTIDARRAALRARYPEWEPVTLSGFLDRSAEKYGDRPFVITDERTASLHPPGPDPHPPADPKY
jgi:fatty-acyl-CoA synthase